MKRIYIIDDYMSSRYNGVGTYVRTLFKSCLDNGLETSIISFNSPVEKICVTADENGKGTTYSFPIFNNGMFLDSGVQAGAILRLHIGESPENVFVINHSPCNSFIRNLKKFFPKSKYVFVIHNQGWNTPLLGNVKHLESILMRGKRSDKSIKKDVVRFIRKYSSDEKRTYSSVNAVIALSQSTYDILKDIYCARMDNVHLIPNGIEAIKESAILSYGTARNRLGLHESETSILFVGRVTESKGIIQLLDAFDNLVKEGCNLRLMIAGAGSNILRYFEGLDISTRNRISILGYLDPDNLHSVYSAADICMIPSFSEQSSYVALEMMAHGKLIVSSDAIGLKEVFTDGENALTFTHKLSTDNPIEDALRRAISISKREKDQMENKCKYQIHHEHSLKKQETKMMNLFDSL